MTPYLFSSPFLLLMIVFMLVPFLLNVVLSFTNYSLSSTTMKFIGLANYINFFSDRALVEVIVKTFIFTAGCLILSMLLGIFFAITMTFRIGGINLIKAIVLLPWIIPESVTAYVWRWLFATDSGIVHYWLVQVGAISPDTSFFVNGQLAMWMIIMSNAWRTAPFVAIMTYAKLKSLPEEQLQAAKIDGANIANTFLYITIPWIAPILNRCAMLLFVWSFNSFTIIYIMTYGGPAGATTTLPFFIRQVAFKHYNFGQACALSVITLVIICVCILIFRLIARLISNRNAAGRVFNEA